jgi:predicted aldo/keto reductase-like oxidoreductase
MAVWDNPHIATICSEMTNLEMLTDNVAAALKRNSPSLADKQLLKQYAQETMSEYCAGCADICRSALEAEVPVCDIMRYLMYARCYREPERAKSLFRELVPAMHQRMGEIDYTVAETSCPQGMPIGRLMKEAIAEFL